MVWIGFTRVIRFGWFRLCRSGDDLVVAFVVVLAVCFGLVVVDLGVAFWVWGFGVCCNAFCCELLGLWCFPGFGIVCWWILLIDLVSWLLVRCCGFGCCDYGCAGL